MSGAEALVGEKGIVSQRTETGGKVKVRGELWQARFNGPVEQGDTVRVTAVDGLVITAVREDA